MNKIKNIFYSKILLFVYNKIKDYWENDYTLNNYIKIIFKIFIIFY